MQREPRLGEMTPPEHRDKRRCLNTEATLPSHPSIGKHEVFISHRGIAMKRGFANHLYHSLKSRGITAFLDMEELPKGEDVRPFMLEAARRAIIQVPIFTRDYAESRWCLDELVEMMKSSSKAKVFPVFYDVKSEDLKNEDGPFAEAIKAHRGKGKYNEDTIKGWEYALCCASWLEGFRLETYNKFEGALCQALVEKIVQQMQDMTPVEDDSKAVGLEERVDDVLKLFQLKEKGIVSFVLLWGMGGIGKTTLARAIHRRLGKEFQQAASFVENCRDKKPIQLQDCLLADLLHEKNFQGNDVGKRRERLKDGLRGKKVLIILDDAENFHSIEEIIDPTSLQPGSVMLVTSRDRTVFPHDNDLSNVFRGERYEVQGMDSDKSLRLFCLNAFKKPSPDLGFEKLAEKVSQACAGLPLSLEVLGRHLSMRKKKKIWEEAIQILSSNATLHKRIETSLKISYDALSGHEQEMFLDVACFLIGRDRQSAEYFWDRDDLVEWPISGLERLIDLCLVKVDEEECLTMHDHLRDLGRGIVKQSGKWSRVWDDTVLSQLLQSKQGLDQIRGIATSQRILNASSLSRMRSLRLLFLDGTYLGCDDEGLKGLEIRWLRWNAQDEAPSKELLDLEFLTVLEFVSTSKCIQMKLPFSYRQLKMLQKLKLKLYFCDLSKDFGSLESLEELHVGASATITRLPSSFGQLKKIRRLDMSSKVEELPEEFGSLESLEELHLEVSAIMRLPSSFGQLKKLRRLDMIGCSNKLKELPEEFGSLGSLEELHVWGSAITRLPSSFGQLKKLRRLDMRWCFQLEELPEEFGSLESLEELLAEATAIMRLPSSFGQLKKLRRLDMSWCSKLEELPEEFGSLGSLEELHLEGSAITRLPSSFGQLKKLRRLDMGWCFQLEELPEEFGSLESLEELLAQETAIMKLPSSFGQLKKLRRLDMSWCSKLEELPEEFGSLESLQELHVWGSAIRTLPSSFGQLKKLRGFRI